MAPAINPIADRIITEGDKLTMTLSASDSDGAIISQTIADFESFDPGTPAGSVMFRHPAFSSTTSGFLTTATNYTSVTDSLPAGNSSARALRVQWTFASGTTDPWL